MLKYLVIDRSDRIVERKYCNVYGKSTARNSMKALTILSGIIIVLSIIWLLFPKEDIKVIPIVEISPVISNANFHEVEADTGCSSKYSEEKKRSLFREMYVNKQFTWTGKVVRSDMGNLWLNMSDALIGDLIVTLSDKRQGDVLDHGDIVTIKFILDSAGGCFLPFKGESGIVLD